MLSQANKLIEAKTLSFSNGILYLLLLLAIFISVYFIKSAYLVITAVFFIAALTGPKNFIISLSILLFLSMSNQYLFTVGPETRISMQILLLISSFIYGKAAFLKRKQFFISITVFTLYAMATSFMVSKAPVISLVKALIFALGAIGLVGAYSSLKPAARNDVISWLKFLILFSFTISLLTLPFPSVAYARNGQGFQGLMSHPQAFGTFITPIATWFGVHLYYVRGKSVGINLVFFCILVIVIILTQARTALVTVFLSMFMCYVVFLFFKPRDEVVKKSRFYLFSIASLVLLISAILFVEPAYEKVESFIFKRDAVTLDEAMKSRAGGATSQWENFLSSPILGHGFGVYPGPIVAKDIRYFMGIPVSAPVEKGVVFTAVLEETGFLGGILWFWIVMSLLIPAFKSRNIVYIGILFSCLFINIGAAIFFSLGATGLYAWLLMAAIATEPTAKNRPAKLNNGVLELKTN